MSLQKKQELISAQKDAEYLNKSYDTLKAKYTNQYIAVQNGNVIAHHERIDTILKILRAKKYNPANILIEFVNPKDMMLIL